MFTNIFVCFLKNQLNQCLNILSLSPFFPCVAGGRGSKNRRALPHHVRSMNVSHHIQGVSPINLSSNFIGGAPSIRKDHLNLIDQFDISMIDEVDP